MATPTASPLDCGRQNCALMYPEHPEQWCRTCLLVVVKRARVALKAYAGRSAWEEASRGHFDPING